MYTLTTIISAIAATAIFVSLLLTAIWWILAHKTNKPGFLLGKLRRAPTREAKKIRDENEVETDYKIIKNRISDISRDLCDHSEQFCLEACDLFRRWITEHIDDYVYEHPNKIIELGESRVNALKVDLNQLQINMREIITDSLLSGHDGVYLDEIEPCIQDIDIQDDIDMDQLSANYARPVRNEMATTKSIDRKFSEIAGRLGNIMAAHGLITGNHQRWIMQKGMDNYQYNGAIMWTDAMRSLFSDYMALKTEYHEHKIKIPVLQAERLRIEATNMWAGRPFEATRRDGATLSVVPNARATQIRKPR